MSRWAPTRLTQVQRDKHAVDAIRMARPDVLASRTPEDWAAHYGVDRRLAEYEIGLRLRRVG